jgi:hypothetical protein
MSDIYKIKPANIDALRDKIAKLNKKAAKLNCLPAILTIEGTETVKATKVMPGGRILKYEYEVLLVRVTGDTPKLAGWSLVAKVEYLEDERMMLCVPGETCPEEFRTRGLDCDHCKSNRARKHVFVLRHIDGQHVQVGRSCIKDFLGGVSPEKLLSQANWTFSVLDACGDYERESCGCRAPEAINIVEYLNAVAICIRRLGWVSRGAVQWTDGSSTSNDAWAICRPDLRTPKDEVIFDRWITEKKLQHQARDEKMASEALAWATEAEVKGTSDYIYNLGVACRVGYVTLKTAGIVASAISSYLRDCERQEELTQREADDALKTREWVGKEKVRQDFTGLTIQYMKYIEGRYGTTTLVAFEDATGNLIRWFASTNLDTIEKGDVVDIKATVKKHDTYKDVKQTMVNRAKILTINGAKA